MTTFHKVKRTAPLRNVAAFATLLDRVVNRPSPDLPGLAVFYGPSGLGKTKAAIFGANKQRAAYVECGQFTTAKSLLSSILFELGVQKPRGTVNDLISEAVNIMASDPSRPVIIDEAHYVAQRSFVNVIGELSRKSAAPMIMIGEETLPKQIEHYERVDNCVLEWVGAENCGTEDFASLLEFSFPDLDIDPDLATAILDKTHGNTRRIVVNLSRAEELGKRTNGSVTLDHFGGVNAINAGRAPSPRQVRR